MKSQRTGPTGARDSRRGSVILESALTLTVSLIVLIQIIELGTVFMSYQGAAERARAGARYASINPDDVDGIKNYIVYGNAEGQGSALLGLKVEDVSISTDPLDNESKVTGISVAVRSGLFFSSVVIGDDPVVRVRLAAPIERVFAP